MRAALRCGFTLLELLVVLGILIILSSIGAAAFANTGKVNRLAGTEQLVGGLLRQARYTARATGQAVLIYVDKDAGTVSGVSRLPMWQSLCEVGKPPFLTGQLNPNDYQVPVGRTGMGFGIVDSTAAPNQAAAVPLFDRTSPDPELRNRARQLTRKATEPTEGFQLGCTVRLPSSNPSLPAPAPTGTPIAIANAVSVGQVWCPLLLIDGESSMTTPGSSDQSYAGLAMVRREIPMFTGVNNDGTSPAGSSDPKRSFYDLVGWVVAESGTIYSVSQAQDGVDAANNANMLTIEVSARRIADDGGTWQEVSLVFTGSDLELYRGGLLVAKKDCPSGLRLEGYGQLHRLSIGSAEMGANLFGQLNAKLPLTLSTDKCIPAGAVIDDLQLVRLGADQPQALPNGVKAAQTYRVLVRPDGRLRDLSAPPGSSITWEFSGVYAEAEDKVAIELNAATGAISTSKITLSQ